MYFWRSFIAVSLIIVAAFFGFAYSQSLHLSWFKALRNALLAAAGATILIILAFGMF